MVIYTAPVLYKMSSSSISSSNLEQVGHIPSTTRKRPGCIPMLNARKSPKMLHSQSSSSSSSLPLPFVSFGLPGALLVAPLTRS